MKKLLGIALILVAFTLSACKKAEEKKPETKPGQPTAGGEFKPQAPKKKKAPALASSLKIYNGETLVKDIPQAEYKTFATSKVKIGAKQHNAILLKELLALYKVEGKNVVVAGREISTPLTWEQATGSDVYVYITPKRQVKVFSASMSKVKFPKRVERITVNPADKPTT